MDNYRVLFIGKKCFFYLIALYLPQYVPFKTTFDIRNSLLIAFLQKEQQDYNTKRSFSFL